MTQPVIHSGVLNKLGGGSLHVWQPRFFELSGRHLKYYDGTSATEKGLKGSIPLEMATIHDRGCLAGDKPCFSIGPGAVVKKGGKEYFLHAADAAGKYEWIAALQLATGNPIYDFLAHQGDADERESTLERISKCALATAGVMKKRGNDVCADCDADLPTWAVVSDDTGVVVCIECIGVHRQLWAGRCKEVQLDSWDDAAVDVVRQRGNETANAELEFLVGFDTPKPMPKSSRAVREEYIRAKYEAKKFTKAATGALAPRKPQRDVVARTSEKSVSVSYPPKYIGVLFLVIQRVLPAKRGKLPCPNDGVLVVANGSQHVASKKGQAAEDDEMGACVQWNEALQIGIANLASPVTVSVVDNADTPQSASASFTVVASQHDPSEDPRPVRILGEDKNRAPCALQLLLSFQGLT